MKPKMQISRMDAGAVANTIDYDWEDPGTMSQVTEAILNYATVNQQLWPYDVTATIMQRLLGRYKWLSSCNEQKTRVELISKFFDAVIRTNCLRAANKSVIMSYMEQELLLKEIMIKNNVRSEIPILDNRVQRSNNQNQNPQPGRSSNQQGSQVRSAPIVRPKYASFNNLGLCYGWNALDGKVCNNNIIGNKCTDGMKRSFMHMCNVWIKNRYCLGSHRRKDHK